MTHPLGLIEGATENGAVVQALIDDLIERGLDPAVPRLFIIDGAKALSRTIAPAGGELVSKTGQSRPQTGRKEMGQTSSE